MLPTYVTMSVRTIRKEKGLSLRRERQRQDGLRTSVMSKMARNRSLIEFAQAVGEGSNSVPRSPALHRIPTGSNVAACLKFHGRFLSWRPGLNGKPVIGSALMLASPIPTKVGQPRFPHQRIVRSYEYRGNSLCKPDGSPLDHRPQACYCP